MVRVGFQFRMLLWNSLFKILAQKHAITNSVTFNYMKLKNFWIYNFFQNFLFQEYASQPTFRRRINVVGQRWNNVDPTLKMKQNPTLDFQRYTMLIQRRCATLKQRWNNIDTTLSQLCSNLASTIVKAVSKSVGLLISTDSLNWWVRFILLNILNNILTIQLLIN